MGMGSLVRYRVVSPPPTHTHPCVLFHVLCVFGVCHLLFFCLRWCFKGCLFGKSGLSYFRGFEFFGKDLFHHVVIDWIPEFARQLPRLLCAAHSVCTSHMFILGFNIGLHVVVEFCVSVHLIFWWCNPGHMSECSWWRSSACFFELAYWWHHWYLFECSWLLCPRLLCCLFLFVWWGLREFCMFCLLTIACLYPCVCFPFVCVCFSSGGGSLDSCCFVNGARVSVCLFCVFFVCSHMLAVSHFDAWNVMCAEPRMFVLAFIFCGGGALDVRLNCFYSRSHVLVGACFCFASCSGDIVWGPCTTSNCDGPEGNSLCYSHAHVCIMSNLCCICKYTILVAVVVVVVVVVVLFLHGVTPCHIPCHMCA